MSQPEGLKNSFNFPQGVEESLLEKMVARVGQNFSIRTTVAHQIEEEGLFFRNLLEMFRKKYPDIITKRFSLAEVRIAVDGYTMVGTIILETESALQSGGEGEQVELLKKDPRGFSLLNWWMNRDLGEFKNFSEEKKQAVLSGKLNGIRRYKEFYNALLAKGVPGDKAPS